MTRKEGRRRRENELYEGKKKDVFKVLNLFMDISLKLASRNLTLFFPACVCIYKSECVCICVYTSCSIMSLACVRISVILQASVGVCVCQCGRVHIFGRLAGDSLSYLIFISDSGND